MGLKKKEKEAIETIKIVAGEGVASKIAASEDNGTLEISNDLTNKINKSVLNLISNGVEQSDIEVVNKSAIKANYILKDDIWNRRKELQNTIDQNGYMMSDTVVNEIKSQIKIIDELLENKLDSEADKLFDVLGYKKRECSNNSTIRYINGNERIDFDIYTKTVTSYEVYQTTFNTAVNFAKPIYKSEMIAINKKIEELGWN